MKDYIYYILFSIISYLVGSISFGIIYSKLKYKDDIRNYGSGNSGMTNTIRTFGKKSGFIVFIGDFLKGFLMVFLAGILTHSAICQALAGFFVVLGHIFPIFFKFKGGKGVATSGGIILAIEPIILPFMLTVFIIILFTTKYMSLASVAMGVLYPLFTIIKVFIVNESTANAMPKIILSVIVGALVIFMHRSNIKRLIAGTENKLGQRVKRDQ